ncbi:MULTISPECIES: hypothetical protein [unclassified Bradyrhizobium]|uniref:hypothetical protein n=1 Tax=unclassified Bradyrhizobium TaxID=2631580 RepID=UPI000B0A6452|nr:MULTISPECIES: hypothetical protein [unclassified Bradyrhizobium]
MRCTVSIICRLIFGGALIVSLIAAAGGQDREATRREWGNLANGRTEYEVSDPALLPSTLSLAAEEAGCRYKDDMKDAPARFMRPEGRRIAIVFCSAITGSHQIFDVSNVMKPTLIELPIIAHPDGFRSTPRPGWITWDREAKVFLAESGSDISLAKLRHVYRMESGSGSFVIVRVQFNPRIDGKDEWMTIWEAPRWSFPTTPN